MLESDTCSHMRALKQNHDIEESATGRVLRCDNSHGQGQRKSRSQYPGGKIRLPGLVPLPVDLSKCSLSSLSKPRSADGGGKGSAPTEERGRESNGVLCVMSVTMERRLQMERLTGYSPCLILRSSEDRIPHRTAGCKCFS